MKIFFILLPAALVFIALAYSPRLAVKYCVGADNTIENRIDCTRSVYGNLP